MCYSFYATKNMTTGEGGMIVTNDPALAEKVKVMRNYGEKEKYHHVALPRNRRLDTIAFVRGVSFSLTDSTSML